MLSAILYGRNDNHGHNYHKRLALSLNCLAENLNHTDDEILFVDYNSSCDLPTVVEAIQDTLTPKAQSLLRVLRVRPQVHQRWAHQTSLVLLEPLARNIGIRRSNSNNKWILSTNVDMIFATREVHRSLSDIAADLPDGFYSLPRFELPENFWERILHRMEPQKNMAFLRAESHRLNLDMIVRREGFLQYDNPGDFQLILRKDIFTLKGFDERMRHGWHVDSNLSKRIFLLRGLGTSIEDQVMSFHCNHTQKESLLHRGNHSENDWGYFVENPDLAPILSQEDWGLPLEAIEEIRLAPVEPFSSHLHLRGLSHCSTKSAAPILSRESFNTHTYYSSKVIPFLVDHLTHFPKECDIAYIGCNRELVNRLRSYLIHQGFSGQILCKELDKKEILEKAKLFIFDFGFDLESSPQQEQLTNHRKLQQIMQFFCQSVEAIRQNRPGTKFIGIQVHHTDFSAVFNRLLNVRLTSFITGHAYGYADPQRKWLQMKCFKRSIKNQLRYLLVRYFFNYRDQLRRLRRVKIVKNS